MVTLNPPFIEDDMAWVHPLEVGRGWRYPCMP